MTLSGVMWRSVMFSGVPWRSVALSGVMWRCVSFSVQWCSVELLFSMSRSPSVYRRVPTQTRTHACTHTQQAPIKAILSEAVSCDEGRMD